MDFQIAQPALPLTHRIPLLPAGKNGFFYEPTILADVQEGVRIVDEEQFGPVMPLIKYSDVDDALVRDIYMTTACSRYFGCAVVDGLWLLLRFGML